MRRLGIGASVAALLVTAGVLPAAAQRQLPARFSDQLVVGNLLVPVGLAFLPDGRLLVAERTGRLRFVVEGKLGVVDPLVEPESLFTSHPEAGILGVAVDPGWPTRPYLYICANYVDATLRVVRYRAEGDLSSGTSVNLSIVPGSRYVVLRIPDVAPGRNGGTLRFGPDGTLHLSVGDDGNACSARDTTSLHGALLRLQVGGLPDGPGGAMGLEDLDPGDNPWGDHPLAAARLVRFLGFGNPFRFQIDPVTGDVVVGDRGQGQYEELDVLNGGGADLGWPYWEGPLWVGTSCPSGAPPAPAAPAYSYPVGGADGASAIVAGGIYRLPGCSGCGYPAAYDGSLFLADAGAGFMRRLTFNGSAWVLATPVSGQPSASDWARGFQGVTDYVVGPDGSIWFCHPGTGAFDGEVRRILYTPPSAAVVDVAAAEVTFAPPAPSPSRGGPVRFSFRLDREAMVELALFDPQGRRVRQLQAPALVAAGEHALVWDGAAERGARVSAGLYIARLVVDGRATERRIPVLH